MIVSCIKAYIFQQFLETSFITVVAVAIITGPPTPSVGGQTSNSHGRLSSSATLHGTTRPIYEFNVISCVIAVHKFL